MLWTIVKREIINHLITFRFVFITVLSVLMASCLYTMNIIYICLIVHSHDEKVQTTFYSSERTTVAERPEGQPCALSPVCLCVLCG